MDNILDDLRQGQSEREFDYRKQFEEETGIDESYDPFGTKEPGFYSEEYKNQFIMYLEQQLKQRDDMIQKILNIIKGIDDESI